MNIRQIAPFCRFGRGGLYGQSVKCDAFDNEVNATWCVDSIVEVYQSFFTNPILGVIMAIHQQTCDTLLAFKHSFGGNPFIFKRKQIKQIVVVLDVENLFTLP